MEYSPFIDKKGNKIKLSKIRFSDIVRIEETGIEEGYKVEFKSVWDDNFKKKHLCQTITSFANAEGGWLIVGIEDGTGKYIGIDKQRTDFSQIISQKLVAVTPMPKFDCRFIHETNNKKRGVLVIQVYEGINPPYVCNGTVYTRNGSSKLPIKSDRSSIDELINKRNKYNDLMKRFCVNNFVDERERTPHCIIYLYNPYKKIDYDCYDEKIDKIKSEFEIDGARVRILDSMDSVIRMGSDVIGANSNTSIEEYFVDDNIKIYMPLFKLNNEGNVSSWITTVEGYNPNIKMKEMTIVDGIVTYMALLNMLKTAFKYIKSTGNKICDYNIIFEYRYVKDVVFYHRHNFNNQNQKDRFVKDVQEGKIYISHLSDVKTEPVVLRVEGTVDDAIGYASELLEMRYLRLFGIDREEFSEILKKCEGKYDDRVFSSEKC